MSMPHTPSAPGYGAPAQPPRKVASKRNTRVYVLGGITAAVFAGLLVLFALGGESGTWVLVARQSIPARASLDSDLFEPRKVSNDAVVSGALHADSEDELKDKAKDADIDGAVAQYPLPKGGQFTQDLVSVETELAKPLGADERLISVPGTYAMTLAGTLKPGDRVDVYAVGSDNLQVANLAISDVEIVSVSLPEDQVSAVYQRQLSAAEEGKELSASELLPAEPIPGVFTLRVPVSVAGNLAVAGEHAKFVLTYRGATAGATPMSPAGLLQVLCSVPAGSNTGAVSVPPECAALLGTAPQH